MAYNFRGKYYFFESFNGILTIRLDIFCAILYPLLIVSLYRFAPLCCLIVRGCTVYIVSCIYAASAVLWKDFCVPDSSL